MLYGYLEWLFFKECVIIVKEEDVEGRNLIKFVVFLSFRLYYFNI